MIKSNKGSIPVSTLILSILLTAVLCGGGVYFLMQGDSASKSPAEKESVATNKIVEKEPVKNEVAKKSGPTLYENEKYGFSLEIPADWGDLDIQVDHFKPSERPEDRPKSGPVAEEILFTSKQDSKKSFLVQIYDLTKGGFGDGATGQSVLYEDGNIGIDLWLRGVPNWGECNYNIGSHNIPDEVCEEENKIVDQIFDDIAESFKKDFSEVDNSALLRAVEDFYTYVPYDGSPTFTPDGCESYEYYLNKVKSGEYQPDDNYEKAMKGVDWERWIALSETIHKGEIKQKFFYKNDDMNLDISLFLTPRYDINKEDIKEMNRCVESVGYVWPYKLYKDKILWADLMCAAAGPGEDLKPGITSATQECDAIKQKLDDLSDDF